MPNLRGTSPVGRDDRGRSYAALTIGGGELGQRVVVEAGFPSDETRPRGRRFHMVSCQKLSLTYQFGELRVN